MLLRADRLSKTIGSKQLFSDLSLQIEDGERVGLIGRNGVGKTTLFGVLSGVDSDYSGEIIRKRGLRTVMTAQEHYQHKAAGCLDYILDSLPEYTPLSHVIQSYPNTMGHDLGNIQLYTEALDRFSELGYETIEVKVIEALGRYGITPEIARGPLTRLSGGQKRFVELVKVTEAQADLALVDEPTNHMDYAAKAAFVDWLKSTPLTVVVITHDRDVLSQVDRIIELRDGQADSFTGNYDAYLSQNSTQTVTAINQYEVAQRTIENLKKQIAYAKSKKSGWSGTADKKNPFVVMEERLTKELKRLQAEIGRPSFWIDQESVSQLNNKLVERYDRYKSRNIRLSGLDAEAKGNQMLLARDLSVGFDHPLFRDLDFALSPGGRLQIRGRNGAGKTTLINALRQALDDRTDGPTIFGGAIEILRPLKLGVYEQEIGAEFLKVKLGEAVLEVFRRRGIPASEQAVRRVLADYLFDPISDYNLVVERLSGGQRARFQLIWMLCHQPDLLILDEPTNHLDLPSIEELETALGRYAGAIIYVSHDSYFTQALGGDVIQIGAE